MDDEGTLLLFWWKSTIMGLLFLDIFEAADI